MKLIKPEPPQTVTIEIELAELQMIRNILANIDEDILKNITTEIKHDDMCDIYEEVNTLIKQITYSH